MKTWQLQQAKSQLSQVVKDTASGPQFISVHGKTTVVLLSMKDYHRLKEKKLSLVDFLQHSPLSGVDLTIKRDQSLGRDVVL